MGKSLDSEALAALHLLSKHRDDGINYIEFVRQNIMNGALDLIERGYAIKVKVGSGEADVNYHFTPAGIRFLDSVLKYASEQT